MKAALACTDTFAQTQAVDERPLGHSPEEAGDSLLSEIGRLGGAERMQGAAGALTALHSALTDLVRRNPKAYGAGNTPGSQRAVASELFASVRRPFLLQTIETLRHEAGYVRVCGRWIHRAVFTFIGFGALAAALLPFCAVSLLSSSAWGWLPGTLGLAAVLALAIWILSRVRSR